MLSIKDIHDFWKNANGKNSPEKYLSGEEKTEFIISKISEISNKSDVILEIGCNAGRNLNGLLQAGYKNLVGIEINYNAIMVMEKEFPGMYKEIKIYNFPAETILPYLLENSIDVIFTMAVLEHIHFNSENIISENIKRIARKNIITIEDEYTKSDRHLPRNYKYIFESEKFIQIEWKRKLKIAGLSGRYIYRLFKRRNNAI